MIILIMEYLLLIIICSFRWGFGVLGRSEERRVGKECV